MTVSELVAMLGILPGELPVYLESLGDFEKVTEVRIVKANAHVRQRERHVLIFGEYAEDADEGFE